MYSKNDRQQLLHQILAFIQKNKEFECLLQIGSGADGYTDIYSDIDCMAGCVDTAAVVSANRKLEAFFNRNGAVYLDHRKWGECVFGYSVYWKNGLSIDLSFMPTSDMPILSSHWKLLWSADDGMEAKLTEKTKKLNNNPATFNEQSHHKFFYALRKAEVAILRENYIYAEIVLSEARQILLLAEAMIEGKKLHQFKAYHTLDQVFLAALQGTYAKGLDKEDLVNAKNALLSLYVRVIEENELCKIDDSQFMIINCFA